MLAEERVASTGLTVKWVGGQMGGLDASPIRVSRRDLLHISLGHVYLRLTHLRRTRARVDQTD